MRQEYSVRLLVVLFGLFLLAGCRPMAQATVHTAVPADSTSTSALFEDATERAGVRFTHTNGAAGHFYFIESTPAGCAMFDYDNDGWLDLLLVQSGPSAPPAEVTNRPHCVLYHNRGDGTFVDVTAGSGLDRDFGYGHGAAIGDYDNDGWDDLFLTGYGGNHLFHNEGGKGRFTDVTARMGLGKRYSTGYATSAALGDYDNDGKLDLYVCYYCPWTWERDKPCYDTRKRRDYCTPELYDPEVHRLYHNEGNRFRDVTDRTGISKATGRGMGVTFLDYDEDGDQDIFVANDLSPNMLWRNDGHGRFTNVAQEAGCAYSEGGAVMAGMGIGIADYDHSGHESLFCTNFSGLPNALFKNSGDGLFQDVGLQAGLALPHMKFLAFGCDFMDYDADGWPDLLIGNGHVQIHADAKVEGVTYKERKQLFHNEGNGKFHEIADPAQLGDLNRPAVTRGLAVGDFDNDGRLDALAMNQNEPVQLFRNLDRSPHHWVSFKTLGTRSNRDGLHARITITAGGMRQTASVRAGSSYLSHSDRRVYFGLGRAAEIDQIEIRWPSGIREVIKQVPADAIYILREGRRITGREGVPAMSSASTAPCGSGRPTSLRR